MSRFNNDIVALALKVVTAHTDEHRMVSRLLQEKSEDTSALDANLLRIEQAVETLSEFLGCY